MSKVIEIEIAYLHNEVESIEKYNEIWGDVHVTKTITKYKPQYLRDAGLLTYDSSLDDAIIKGLFKHYAAYKNQDWRIPDTTRTTNDEEESE